MDKHHILAVLQKGDLNLEGQFLSGSNYTFLGPVTLDGDVLQAVYKPVRGEQPLWDFPAGSLAHREAAAYIFSEALGWELVPPTIYRRKAPIGPGSLQLYIDHDPNLHYFTLEDDDKQRLRPAVLFDLAVNNADRKGGHILRGEDGHFWFIDHGLCFHVEDKLRTVMWDFGGEPFPVDLAVDLERVESDLAAAESSLREDLEKHLRPGEVSALAARIRRMLRSGCFPQPPTSRRYYPWPPV
jgi:uncharacterized repeat protein (TIGR03843 family)